MNNTHLVSILTPTYNHAEYISKCIESVLSQSYSNWEMIIINDGSTDETRQILEGYSKKDKRIKVINQANLGINRLNEIYNIAFRNSHGQYICILEGDDYWEHEKLEFQTKILDSNQQVVLTYGIANGIISETGRIMRSYPQNFSTKVSCYNNNPVGSYFDIVYDDFSAPLTYMIRRDCLDKIGGFSQVLPFPSVDLSTFLSLSLLGPFDFQNKLLGVWRISSDQTTKVLPVEIFEGSQLIISQHLRSLPEEIKKMVSINEQRIAYEYKKRRIVMYTRYGRILLIKKNFVKAREAFSIAILNYSFIEWKWKVRAIIGYFLSWLKMDLEFLAEKFGKGRFN